MLFHEVIILSSAKFTSSKIIVSFALTFPNILVESEVGPKNNDLKAETTVLNELPSAENAEL